jgi:hypothetical protein
MEHKLAHLLRAAADDADAMFTRVNGTLKYQIEDVIHIHSRNQDWEWKLAEYEYRIKPLTVTKWLWANSDGGISEIMMTEANYGYGIKLEWSKTDFEVAE